MPGCEIYHSASESINVKQLDDWPRRAWVIHTHIFLPPCEKSARIFSKRPRRKRHKSRLGEIFKSHKATTSRRAALLTMVHYSSRVPSLMLDQFYMDGSNNGLYYCYYTKPAIMTIKRWGGEGGSRQANQWVSQRESKKPVVWTTLPDATAFQGVRRPPPPSGSQGQARRGAARVASPPGGQVADSAAQVAGERWRLCARGRFFATTQRLITVILSGHSRWTCTSILPAWGSVSFFLAFCADNVYIRVCSEEKERCCALDMRSSFLPRVPCSLMREGKLAEMSTLWENTDFR